jgi:hypothetical protein
MTTGTGYPPDPNAAPVAWGQPLPKTPGSKRRRRVWLLSLTVVAALVAVFVGGWVYDYSARTDAFERAHAAFQRGDCPTALANYAQADRGKVPWGSKAEPSVGGTPEIDQCHELKRLADAWDAGNYAVAAKGYSSFAKDYADSAALIPLWALVQKSAGSKDLLSKVPSATACSALESVSSTSATLAAAFTTSTELKSLPTQRVARARYNPATLVSCAATFEKKGQTAKAAAFYSTAMTLKPAKAVLSKAISGKARTTVKLAKAANAGSLPTPQRLSGTGSGPAVVVIRNDSPNELALTMSGTKPVVTTIKACTSCHKYSHVGPVTCPDTGPQQSFRVPAGTYSVVVESKSTGAGGRRVTPFAGSWDLSKGSRYESCFFIVTQ